MSLFPFTREGRQTLVYLAFVGAGPALTAIVIWSMLQALRYPALWPTFTKLALIVATGLFVILCGLAMFVSIRAVKISTDGFEAGAKDNTDGH